MTPKLLAAAAILALAVPALLAAPRSDAQTAPARPPRGTLPGTPVEERALPYILTAAPPPEVWRTQRPVRPLSIGLNARLRRAVDLRQAGLLAQARDTLLALDRLEPAHPLVAGELARVEMALGQDASAAQRLRAMRAANRDSVAGSHELAQALEHVGKPREAAAVVIESWSVMAPEGRWALPEVLRLAPTDLRAITDLLARSYAARPDRTDLLRGLAVLDSRQGRAAEAVRRLALAELPGRAAGLRMEFADQIVLAGMPSDTLAAIEALVSAASETSATPGIRAAAAQRALDLAPTPAVRSGTASRLATVLSGVPVARWDAGLLVAIARELRLAGRARQAEALLARAPTALAGAPEMEFERLLAVLREGPAEHALPGLDSLASRWPPARFMRAEALFFAGQSDSAVIAYGRAAKDESSADAMTALDRAYLLESDPGSPALRALGAVAYARWRGETPLARALADSLWRELPLTSPCYAAAAMQAYQARADAAAWRECLAPLAAIADSLPGDRLAPLARQRAGEAWLALGDAKQARGQFEECLARYPRAWNAAEVRRRLEPLRKGTRL